MYWFMSWSNKTLNLKPFVKTDTLLQNLAHFDKPCTMLLLFPQHHTFLPNLTLLSQFLHIFAQFRSFEPNLSPFCLWCTFLPMMYLFAYDVSFCLISYLVIQYSTHILHLFAKHPTFLVNLSHCCNILHFLAQWPTFFQISHLVENCCSFLPILTHFCPISYFSPNSCTVLPNLANFSPIFHLFAVLPNLAPCCTISHLFVKCGTFLQNISPFTPVIHFSQSSTFYQLPILNLFAYDAPFCPNSQLVVHYY